MININRTDRLGRILFEDYLGSDSKSRFLLRETTSAESKEILAKNIIKKVIASVKFKEHKLDTKDIEKSGGNFNKLRNKDYIISCVKYFETFNLTNPDKNITRYTLALNETIKILTNPNVIKKFEEGYQENISITKYLYTSTCLNLILAVSSIISFLVTYIKEPNGSYLVAFSRENESDVKYIDLLINNLEEFNNSYRSGGLFTFFKSVKEIEKKITIAPAVSEDSEFTSPTVEGVFLKESLMTVIGAVGFSIVASIAIVLLLINAIRFTIYLYYKFRMGISDLYEQQAYFIELNASNLDRKTNAAVIKKQEYQAKKLRKISDMIRGELKDSMTKTESEIKKEEKYLQTQVGKEDFQSSAVLI